MDKLILLFGLFGEACKRRESYELEFRSLGLLNRRMRKVVEDLRQRCPSPSGERVRLGLRVRL